MHPVTMKITETDELGEEYTFKVTVDSSGYAYIRDEYDEPVTIVPADDSIDWKSIIKLVKGLY